MNAPPLPEGHRVDRSPDGIKAAREIERMVQAKMNENWRRPAPEKIASVGGIAPEQMIADMSKHPEGSLERMRLVWQASILERTWYYVHCKGMSESEAKLRAESETRADFARIDEQCST